MGVGNYRSDYGGTGRSINVRGPLGEERHYEAYKAEVEKEADGYVMSREEWAQDEYDQANEDLASVAEAVAKSVGLVSDLKGRFGKESASFDGEMVSVASGDVFDVAWRAWQHDFVVAIGPSRDFGDFAGSPDCHEDWALSERGRPAAALSEAYQGTLAEFEELMRLSLLAEGIETATPTSAWTSSTDTLPDGHAARIEELTKSVREGIASLSRTSDKVLSDGTVEERLALAKAVLEFDPSKSSPVDLPRVLVATKVEDGSITLWGFGDDHAGPQVGLKAPDSIRAYVDALPLSGDGIAAIPHDETTEAWFRGRNGRDIVLSAEQYAAVTDGNCVVEWHDEDTAEDGVLVLHGEGPAPSPTP